MPIIESLLDMDFYKYTMGQLVFKKYPDVPVKYAFKCRTPSVKLAEVIKEEDLRRELDHARTLRSNNSELHYLRGTNEYGERMFCEDYLQFLKDLRLPEYYLKKVDGNYKLEFSGPWAIAIYWETIALAIINELYNRALMERLSDFERDCVYAEGKIRLAEKIKKLRTRPGLTFTDFGTRRRFSREWQDYEVEVLAQELPGQFIGTSNTYLAMKHGLVPMGTSAHELFMIYTGIMHSDEEIRASQRKVLENWWDLYGWGLSIALTDTYGSDFFFDQVMTKEQAHQWKGLRQDSGDPFEFGDKNAIPFYKRHKVNPKEKLVIFSDGLEVDLMIRLYDHFIGRIKPTFGWGTNLTNDLGFKPLSIVIKAVEANGHGLVKLSDNLAKAIGRPEDIKRAKRIFGYTGTTFKPVKY